MDSVVGNITQHAGMEDDRPSKRNPKLNSLNIDFRMYFVSRWC